MNAYRDYFQVGESTAMKCVKLFTKEITTSPFRQEYFRSTTQGDAKRVEALHAAVHGVRGMIGSLDCSHIVWGNCPVAHHGQYQGKEGKPTIVVEAMVDYSLYAWHAVFGYCGTLNDITIWDNSLLLQAMCDGSFEDIDFPFNIGGEVFQQLLMLVDGIYPPLSRFVKPIAVRERIDSNEELMENDAFYDCIVDMEPAETVLREPRVNPALQFTNMQENHVMERALEVEYLSALGINVVDATLVLDLDRISVIPQYQHLAQYRWSQLYTVGD